MILYEPSGKAVIKGDLDDGLDDLAGDGKQCVVIGEITGSITFNIKVPWAALAFLRSIKKGLDIHILLHSKVLLAFVSANDHVLIDQIKLVVKDITSCIVIIEHLLFDVAELFCGDRCFLVNDPGIGGVIIRLDTEFGKGVQIPV